jgi:hypothetical protein
MRDSRHASHTSRQRQDDPHLVAAYVGRGTAHAMAAHLDDADRDLAAACVMQPDNADIWKRRAQVTRTRERDRHRTRVCRCLQRAAASSRRCERYSVLRDSHRTTQSQCISAASCS